MLATFVIGLREGLEAALIVGIIAAFLKRNGHSLRSMWVGVVAAILLSVGVGIVLEIISVGLPQAEQEGMESIIGAVAVVMVTVMIVWMSKHARNMRSELESEAGDALARGSVFALAVMAFLAVLREGFETSVFLLAAFQSSVSPFIAGAGAVIGLLLAVLIGYAIYRGGIKLNLGKFFTVTGVFLVFVAAGLVMSALRTAHEAGWIVIGQATTFDLSWLAPNGSVQAALVTGVLGIPADPRVVEVLGWLLYLVPVLLFVLWPHALRPGKRAYRVQFGLAATAAVAAVVLLVAVPAAGTAAITAGPSAIIAADGRQIGTTELQATPTGFELASTVLNLPTTTTLDAVAASSDTHLGEAAQAWAVTTETDPTGLPAVVTLDDIGVLNGGRTPVGVNRALNPGPFDAVWQVTLNQHVWAVGDTLLDATSESVTTLTISGGGLTAPRTVTVSGGDTAPESLSWTMDAQQTGLVAAALSDQQSAAEEVALFRFYLPAVLAITALILAAFGLRGWRAARRDTSAPDAPGPGSGSGSGADSRTGGPDAAVDAAPGILNPTDRTSRPTTVSAHS